jgi:hypothetical protein
MAPRYLVGVQRDSNSLLDWAISEAIAACRSFRAFGANLLVLGFMPLAVPAQFLWGLRDNTESATPLSDVTPAALALDYSSRTCPMR